MTSSNETVLHAGGWGIESVALASQPGTADVIDQRVIPMLSYEDAGRAPDWIAKAFGFEEAERFEHEGTVDHEREEPASEPKEA